jgi:hypothetical protein
MLERWSFSEIGLVTEKEVDSSELKNLIQTLMRKYLLPEDMMVLCGYRLSIITLLLVTSWNLFVQ